MKALSVMPVAKVRREVRALIVSTGLFMVGYSMLVFSIPLFAAALGSSQSELGLLGVLYVLPSFLMPVVVGKFLDRTASRVAHFIMAAYAVPTLFFLFGSDFLQLATIRAFQGLFHIALWVSIEKELSDRSPFGDRGKVMGFFNMSWASAFCLGPFLGGFLIDTYGFKVAFFASFLLQVAALVPLLHPRPGVIQPESSCSHVVDEQEPGSLRAAYLVSGMSGVILGPLFSLFPAYVTNMGFSAVWAGFFILVFSASRVTAFLGTGLIVDKVGEWRLMLGGTFLLTSVVAVGLFSKTELLAMTMLPLGLAFGMAYTAAITSVSRSPFKSRGVAIGKFETAFNLGIAAMSQLGGVTADLVGPWSPYILSGSTTFLGFIVLLTLYRVRSNRARGHGGL